MRAKDIIDEHRYLLTLTYQNISKDQNIQLLRRGLDGYLNSRILSRVQDTTKVFLLFQIKENLKAL